MLDQVQNAVKQYKQEQCVEGIMSILGSHTIIPCAVLTLLGFRPRILEDVCIKNLRKMS